MYDSMEVYIRDGTGHGKYMTLPAIRYKVDDTLDKIRVKGDYSVKITSCELVPELEKRSFTSAEMESLNILANRIDELSEPDSTGLTAYRAFLKDFPLDTDIKKLLQYTMDIENTPVYPCGNDAEYGEIVLENDWLPELENVSEEVIEMIDAAKAGKLMREREGGVFIDGYYVVKTSYQPPELDMEAFTKLENWIFTADICLETNTKNLVTLNFPATDKEMSEALKELGAANVSEVQVRTFYSVVPGINIYNVDKDNDISLLNSVAEQISQLGHDDFVKFKALSQVQNPENLYAVEALILNLDQYQIDISVRDKVNYRERMLEKMLPAELDRSLVRLTLSDEVAQRNDVNFTDYGIVSRAGHDMFALPEAQDEQAESEDFEMKL